MLFGDTSIASYLGLLEDGAWAALIALVLILGVAGVTAVTLYQVLALRREVAWTRHRQGFPPPPPAGFGPPAAFPAPSRKNVVE